MQHIYLNKETTYFPKEIFDIILSPSFYWIKKESLSFSKAKKLSIAPSLFEGELPEGKYDYYVKDDIFIAFDRSKIKLFLEEKGVNLSKVRRLYFAEFECQESLTEIGGLHFQLPDTKIDQENISIKTKKFVPFHSVDKNLKAVPILISFGVFTLLNAVTFFGYSTTEIEKEIEKIKTKYKLPQTTYQLISEVARYKDIEEEQMGIRDKLYKLTRKRKNYEKVVIENRKIVLFDNGKKVIYE